MKIILAKGANMARILENSSGRRSIILSTDDVISIVREYQKITYGINSYGQIRQKLNSKKICLPEEIV